MASNQTVKDIYVGLLDKASAAAPGHAPLAELLQAASKASAEQVASYTSLLVACQDRVRAHDVDFFCGPHAPAEVRALRLGEIRDKLSAELVAEICQGLSQTIMVHMALGMIPPELRSSVEAATQQLTNTMSDGGSLDTEAITRVLGSLISGLGSAGGGGLVGGPSNPSSLTDIAMSSIGGGAAPPAIAMTDQQRKVAEVRKRLTKRVAGRDGGPRA